MSERAYKAGMGFLILGLLYFTVHALLMGTVL